MPPKNTPTTPAVDPHLSFEVALANLEELVSKLEGGKLGLADSLEAYQQGVAHLRQCYELLEKAELKIAQVSGLDDQGRPRLEPYHDASSANEDEASDDLQQKAAARSQRRSAAKQDASDAGARSRSSRTDDQRLF